MNDPLMLLLFLIAISIAAVDIIRRAVLLMIEIDKDKLLTKRMRQLRKPVQPWVTILVVTNGNSAALENTLKSLKKSYYHNYDVRVVKRSVKHAYRQSKRGKIIICLDAGYAVDTYFIKRAVALKTNENGWWVPLGKAMDARRGILGVTQKLHAVFRLRSGERVRVVRSSYFNRNPACFRKTYQETVPIVEASLLLLIIAGVVYGGAVGLLYGWVLFVVYVMALIAVNRDLPSIERLKLSFSSLSALYFLPVASLTQGILQLYKRK
jgi:cellulose synthase/poly-beta-1,6-N-acetylglucosamine synthase-like glycosyltransferase